MRLTDSEISHIFCQALVKEGYKKPDEQNKFLTAFADAVRMAKPEDFLILRPVSIILIAKYGLLEGEKKMLVHDFPRRRA